MIRDILLEDEASFINLGNQISLTFNKVYKLENEINNRLNKIKVYTIDGSVIGFIHVSILDRDVNVINIVVDKDYRNHGVGSKLLDNIIKENDNKVFYLEVAVNNISAINLYKKYGFKEKGIRKGYYNGVDAITMVKDYE